MSDEDDDNFSEDEEESIEECKTPKIVKVFKRKDANKITNYTS